MINRISKNATSEEEGEDELDEGWWSPPDSALKDGEERVMQRIIVTITDLFNGRRMCQVEEGLFLGSYGDASYKDRLKSLNVTHILTVANLAPAFPNDFVYKVVDVMDFEDTHIGQHFEECINFIYEARRQGGSILVHCLWGISRRSFSCSILHLHEQFDLLM
ncbi:dual specificity protein phosphatase 1-like isoform X2 [Syzygium oleosum]|uniref:dual specificity protein phosphatase 1-like isoform X2 n=1 Tax=Syzygium oleosum TaxID=219896 RepID=UPI0024B98ED7|nr:dual specificity protein phosphatase 1-like isoform X2 [Syzygium oleosum]